MWDYDEKTVSWADLWAFDLLQHVNEARGNDGVDDDDDEGDDYDGDSRGGLSNTNLQVHDGLKSDKNEVQGNPRGVTMAARARDASNAAATTLIIEKQKDRQRVRPLRRASVGGGESRLFIDMTVGLCQREGLLEALGADPVRFREMIELLEMEYPDNPYHCALHAADVLWSAHALFKVRGREGGDDAFSSHCQSHFSPKADVSKISSFFFFFGSTQPSSHSIT